MNLNAEILEALDFYSPEGATLKTIATFMDANANNVSRVLEGLVAEGKAERINIGTSSGSEFVFKIKSK